MSDTKMQLWNEVQATDPSATKQATVSGQQITSIKCPLFSITLAKGVEVAVIDQESALPDECVAVQTTIKPDKREILRRLKAGEDVPGAHIERGQSSVRIK